MSLRRGIASLLLVGLAAPLPCLAGGSGAGSEKSIERGRALYEVHCQSCHGVEADGRGEMAASLSKPPPDLTALRSRGDKAFPAERIHRAIDGRRRVPGHLRKEMPIWGLTFQELDRDSNQENEVRGKIASIVAFLESIQRSTDDD